MTLDKEDIYGIAKAVVKVIEDKDMMKSKTNDCTSEKVVLQTLNAGDVFKVAGYEWIVLDQFKYLQTCFCIMRDFLCDIKLFDKYCNNWKSSSLRQDLKSIGYKIEDRLDSHDALQYMERDLMALDGTKSNQTSNDKVSLLTLDEYRLYRKYLEHPAKSKSKIGWALLTAVSEYNTPCICAVDTEGMIKYCNCNISLGIRPVCTFKSNILVEKVDS